MCLPYRLGRGEADVPIVGGAVCRVFSESFSGTIFRGKPETYLEKLQLVGLRNSNVAILLFGELGEGACALVVFLVIRGAFFLLFLMAGWK